MTATSPPATAVADRLDHGELQRRLLADPSQSALWLELSGADPRPVREASVEPVAAPAPTLPVEPERTAVPAAPPRLDPARPRPLRRRFPAADSEEARLIARAQCRELAQLVRAGEHASAIRRLGADQVESLAQLLEPQHSYALGHQAYEQQRHDLALPLLRAVVASGEQAGDLLAWAQLFSALSLHALGELSQAEQQLEILAAQLPQEEPEASTAETIRFHASAALSWLALARGERSRALELVQLLRESPLCAEHPADVDLLGRVLSTLEWLESNPREQLQHAVDLAESCSFVAAIDAVRLSACGTLLQIEGWVVDPAEQLQELCLVRGERVWRLNLGEASRQQRPDLLAVAERCHAGADLDAGLRLQVLAMPEERFPLRVGEAAELFVVLANGQQFCLRRMIQPVVLQTEQIKQVLDVAIIHPSRLQAPMLLHRAREIWSQELRSKVEQPAVHACVGGARPAQPELSVVVPLYGRIDFMEYQLNWFNAWQRRRGRDRPAIQLIYVLDDPRLENEFKALVKRCQALFSVPFETVVNSVNMGFAGANNRGVQFAEAPILLLLNSDVLPAGDDSLELMLRAMQHHSGTLGALGARLLFDNGAIQHQAMEFVTEPDLDGDLSWLWLNDHPLKGVNTTFSQELQRELQEVEAATAACLMMPTELYREVGGLSSHYVVGDFEDSDLCLKIRAHGYPIAVDLAAVFHHLERQSVGLGDQNDSIKAKVVMANAITHHQRWCSAIERLKRSEVAR